MVAILDRARDSYRTLISGDHYCPNAWQVELFFKWIKQHLRIKAFVSDANRYAIETVGDPRYPLDLFLRVITVSLETMRVVRALPELEIK